MINLNYYHKYLTFTIEDYQAYQLSKLIKFVNLIKKNSFYYKNKLSGISKIQTYKDFEKLPLLVQADLRNQPIDEIRAVKWDQLTTVSSSSGTTGESKNVLWTKTSLSEDYKWIALNYLLSGVNKKSRMAMAMPLELSRCSSHIEAWHKMCLFYVPIGKITNDAEKANCQMWILRIFINGGIYDSKR